MVASVDPTKTRFYPEEIPEAIATTANTSGASIASYSSYDPYTMFLKSIYTGHTPAVTLRVDNDGGHASIESPLVARPSRLPVLNELPCYDSLDMWMVSSAGTPATFITYTLKITKLSVFEKYKLGLSLDDRGVQLLADFDIVKRYSAGLLRSVEQQSPFKKIVEVSRNVTVAAGASGRVGRIVQVKRGEKAVLLGVAVDPGKVQADLGGPGVDNTYLQLTRDVIDTQHFSLDCACMPSIDTEVPCYIPAQDKLEILVNSAAGVTNLPVRYRYGVADITILEKIRWGITLTADETSIANELDLVDSVDAGVF